MPKSRRRALIVSIILLCGLGAGFFLRAEWDRREFTQDLQELGGDRAETMAFLFEKFCVGELRGHRVNPRGLLKPIFFAGQDSWLEEKSGLRIDLDIVPPKQCAVTDDVKLMTKVEKHSVRAIVHARIGKWTPELTKVTPDKNEFFFLEAWRTLDSKLNVRWGIILFQFEEFGEMSYTGLSIGMPKN